MTLTDKDRLRSAMQPLLLAIASGVLLALSLPPYNVEWLGWIALAPALVAAGDRRPLEAMGLGLVAGLVCGILHAGWIADTHARLYAYLPFLWLAILAGVVAACAAAARRKWDGARWVTHVACVGVASEWLTTFSPLPLNLAACQYEARPLLQIAALTGIWGVSFLLWWSNAALADAGLLRRRMTPSIGLAVAAVALAVGYGSLALRHGISPGTVILRAAAIQDYSAGETASFAPAGAAAADEPDRETLTRRAVAAGARLVVWSEGCLGGAFAPDAEINPTADLAQELSCSLVVGYSEPAEPKPFNCAAIVAPDGAVKGIHRKIRLFLGERQSVQPGRAARAFDTPVGRLGVEICFDNCCTGITRRIARGGAQLIAVPNYDPPTPYGILHRLHGALLPFRAVENHVPFIRADANGLSQIVDATGRIVAEAPLFTSDALVGDVALGDGRGTPFTRLGDWLAYACLLVVVAGLVALRPGAKQGKTAPESQPWQRKGGER